MKVIQKVGSLILAGLTCLAAALSLSPLFETKGAYNASADEFERQSRTDVNFEFSPGAAVRTDADEDTIEGLRFGIKLKNTDIILNYNNNYDCNNTLYDEILSCAVKSLNYDNVADLKGYKIYTSIDSKLNLNLPKITARNLKKP